MPINIDIPTDSRPRFTEITSGHPPTIADTQAKKIPNTKPITPPNAVKYKLQ